MFPFFQFLLDFAFRYRNNLPIKWINQWGYTFRLFSEFFNGLFLFAGQTMVGFGFWRKFEIGSHRIIDFEVFDIVRIGDYLADAHFFHKSQPSFGVILFRLTIFITFQNSCSGSWFLRFGIFSSNLVFALRFPFVRVKWVKNGISIVIIEKIFDFFKWQLGSQILVGVFKFLLNLKLPVTDSCIFGF